MGMIDDSTVTNRFCVWIHHTRSGRCSTALMTASTKRTPLCCNCRQSTWIKRGRADAVSGRHRAQMIADVTDALSISTRTVQMLLNSTQPRRGNQTLRAQGSDGSNVKSGYCRSLTAMAPAANFVVSELEVACNVEGRV